MQFIGSLLLLMFSFTLFVGCEESNVEDVNTKEGNSTFEVVQVKKSSFRAFSTNELWPDLKNKAVVDLEACIEDTTYIQKIVGEKFSVESDLSYTEEETKINGCFTWTEEFEFDYTADETYFKLEGVIKGESNYKGTKRFRVAVNPWSLDIVDLAHGTVGKLKPVTADLSSKSLNNQLEISEVDVKFDGVDFRNDRTELRISVQSRPVLKRKKIDGNSDSKELSAGEFATEFYLIEKDKSSHFRKVIASASSTDEIDDKGKLVSTIEFILDEPVKYQSIIELGMKSIPINAPKSIGINEGYIVIDSLDGANSGKLTQYTTGLIEIQKNSVAMEDNMKKDKRSGLGFIIDEVVAVTLAEEGQNLNARRTERSLRSEIRISVLDSLVYQGFNSSFDIEIVDLKTNDVVYSKNNVITKLRQGSGELVLDANIEFGQDYELGYRDYMISIRGNEAPFRDVVTERLVYINPRVTGRGFLIDSFYHPEKPKAQDVESPELYIKDVAYDFISNNADTYKLNKNLDLVTGRVMRLRMYPKMRVNHNFNGVQGGDEPIMTGEYRVSFAVMVPKKKRRNLQAFNRTVDLNDFETIMADERVVTSDRGEIEVDMELKHLFKEREFIAAKSLAVVYIEPVAKDSILKPGYLVGGVSILNGRGKIESLYDDRLKTGKEVQLIHSNEKIARYLRDSIDEVNNKFLPDKNLGNSLKAYQQQVLPTIKEMASVIDHDNFKVVQKEVKLSLYKDERSFLNNEKVQLSASALKNLIVNTNKANVGQIRALCRALFDPSVKTVQFTTAGYGTYIETFGYDYKRCKEDPAKHIYVKELRFIEKITSQPPELEKMTGEASVTEKNSDLISSEAFFISKGRQYIDSRGVRNSNYYGTVAKAGLEYFKLPFIAAIAGEVGSKKDIYQMESDQSVMSDQRRILNQDAMNFVVDSIKAKFGAEVKKCLVVGAKRVLTNIPDNRIDTADAIREIIDFFKKNDTSEEDMVMVSSEKRHIVCAKDTIEEELVDHWYMVRIASHMNNNNGADYSLAKNSKTTIIRGTNNFIQFRKADLHKEKKVILKDNMEKGIVERYNNYMKKHGKEVKYEDSNIIGFPGLVEY